MQFIFCAASHPSCCKLPQYPLKVPAQRSQWKPIVAITEPFQPWGNFEILSMKTEPVTKGQRPTSSWTRFNLLPEMLTKLLQEPYNPYSTPLVHKTHMNWLGKLPWTLSGGFHNQEENHTVSPASEVRLKQVLLRIERSQMRRLCVAPLGRCSGEEPGWAGGARKRRWMDGWMDWWIFNINLKPVNIQETIKDTNSTLLTSQGVKLSVK